MANRHNITFNTEAEYNTFKASANYVEPNVSYITEDNLVHYNPYIDPCQIHDYVDLGLPSGTKWATKNVGACSETDYGNYYQYGKGSAQYAATSGESYYTGTENPLAATADTATVEWGDGWHMPTSAQCQELIDNTTYEWTTINGVNGVKFTAQNGNYVFFPAAGYWFDGRPDDVGSNGYLWSSTPNGGSKAYYLFFNNDYLKGVYGMYRDVNGYSVRPVLG